MSEDELKPRGRRDLPGDLEMSPVRDPNATQRARPRLPLQSPSAATEMPAVDGYHMVRKLGQGGMGAVFLAEDQQLEREVAVKIVSQTFHKTAAVRQRFEGEIRALAALQHTYIAQLFSAGTYQGLPYFVMEFVNGSTLEELAREPMKPPLAARVVGQLCEAVEYCHQQGILHRDLKPSNVLLQRRPLASQTSTMDGGHIASGQSVATVRDLPAEHLKPPTVGLSVDNDQTLLPQASPQASPRVATAYSDASPIGIENFVPKIADFGLAKVINADSSATQTGEILGTPGYMSPEQASGVVKALTPACDVYALGAILYRLLTGRPPFAASEPLQAVMQVLSDEPVRPRALVANVPHELETICLKCLEKNPSRRYSSAVAMFDDLRRYSEGVPIAAKPAGWFERSVKWSKRNPTRTLAYVGTALLTLLSIGGLVWHTNVLSEELAKTRRLADHGSELSKWLIQDHLTDLNTIAGTTSNRHELIQRVQSYLDASVVDMPPDSKYTKQLGYAYMRLAAVSGGDDQNNLGDLKTAEASYRKSLQLYDAALSQGAAKSEILKLKADTLLSLADVYRELQQPEQNARYLAMAGEQLQFIGADDWDGLFLQIQWIEQQAERAMASNDFETGLQQLDEAHRLLDTATEEANQEEVENQRIWLASTRSRCLELLGRLDEALQSYENTVALAKAASEAQPDNALAKRRHASTLVQHADIVFSSEQVEQSLELYQQALEIIEQMYNQDPASVELAVDLALKHSRVCTVQRYLENFAAANEAISKAIQLHEELNQQGKSGQSLQQSLATYLLSKADLCVATNDYATAELYFDRHEALCHALLEANPDSLTELNQLAEHHFQRGVMLVRQWFGQTHDTEAKSLRASPEYLAFRKQFDQSLVFYEKIKTTHGLDYHQEQYRQQVVNLLAVVEQSIDDMIAAEQQAAKEAS